MGEDVRFARHSQKNIRELIGRHETAQTELFSAIQELQTDVALINPRNKPLLRKLNKASFAMRELQNNWNSLQFAFEHLMVNKSSNQSESTKKSENNNLRTALSVKEEIKTEPKDTTDDEEEDEDDDDDDIEKVVSPRRSPRVRRSSSRASETTHSGRSTPVRDDKRKKRDLLKSSKSERRRNNSELQRQGSINSNSVSEPESLDAIVPKRESLRRVLELSKQQYEQELWESNKNGIETVDEEEEEESETEEPTPTPPPPPPKTSHAPTTSSTEPKKETNKDSTENGNAQKVTEEPTTKTENKPAVIMPKVIMAKLPLEKAPEVKKVEPVTTPPPPKKARKEGRKEPKTDPKILARQRELYHKRKERMRNDQAAAKSLQSTPVFNKSGTPTEKGRPWSKIPDRKTPPQILEKRKRQYHEKRAREKQQQQQPNILKTGADRKTLQKIEPSPSSVSTAMQNRIAITPTKQSFTHFLTVVPPVVTSDQYKTFQSMSELNDRATLVVLPTTAAQATTAQSTSSLITKAGFVTSSFTPKLDPKHSNGHPRHPKKRIWPLAAEAATPEKPVIGSTNGQSLPGAISAAPKPESTPQPTTTTKSSSSSSDSSSTNGGAKYMRKKVLADFWVKENSTNQNDDTKPRTASSSTNEKTPRKDEVKTPSSTPTQPPSTPSNPSQNPPPPPPPTQKTPTQKTSANHILKNRLTQQPPVSVE